MHRKNQQITEQRSGFQRIIRQLFEFRKGPTPWLKAFLAGVCSGAPVLIGALTGELALGMLGGIGGFTYLYVFNETYAARMKKIFLVALTISFLVGLGTLVAPYPWLVVLIVGFIGFSGTFIFGVLKIPGPAAIFFVLSFTMAVSLPVDQSLALTRFAVVLASGLFAWVVSMLGWFWHPYKAEMKAVEMTYLAIGAFSEAIGTKEARSKMQPVIEALRRTEEMFATGLRSENNKREYNRLVRLSQCANDLFLNLIEVMDNQARMLPEEVCQRIKNLSNNVNVEKESTGSSPLAMVPTELTEVQRTLMQQIIDIENLMNCPLEDPVFKGITVIKSSWRKKLSKALDRDSIVYIHSLKYGVILSIAAAVAFSFPFTKPYWIPLSCAAVMFGSTIMTTFNRAILRSFGTLIGAWIAVAILSFHPVGVAVALINMVLTMITEIVVVRNYALVAMFITPNALILAEAVANTNNPTYFVYERIINIFVGSMIGLIGTYLIGRKSASNRLSGLIAKLIRSQARCLVRLQVNQENEQNQDLLWIKNQMEINLGNLKLAYHTALGEIPRNQERLERMWSVIASLEHLSYLLTMAIQGKGYLPLSEKELAQMLVVLEKMAMELEQDHGLTKMKQLELPTIATIANEINHLQKHLYFSQSQNTLV